MSLGLNSADFDLSLANELSPMAGETFAFNHLGVDLTNQKAHEQKSVVWLSSAFSREDIKSRLRENPYEFPDPNTDGHFDLEKIDLTGKGQLVIGSIVDLNIYLDKNIDENADLKEALQGIDLVSGGPPCQSFSMAGLRQLNNHRNRLPWEFAKFVELVKPKVALLENVSGILRAFHENGEEFHAWREVSKAFASIGYAPICVHANAKYVGVAQNRPRFLMFAIKNSEINKISPNGLNAAETAALDQAKKSLSENFDWNSFVYWDVANSDDSEFFNGTIFNALKTHPNSEDWVSAQEALRDLEMSEADDVPMSDYVNNINELFGSPIESEEMKNLAFRKHGERVRRRFRLYQVLESLGRRSLAKDILSALDSDDQDRLSSLVSVLADSELLFENETVLRPASNNSEITALVTSLKTRKHSQRALLENKPAPAALSIPDDCCHYSRSQLRTLSVREVARLQSFPDSFEFRSKVTTGGTSRRFEVPQYTQAGNAVPPLLARSAGTVVKKLIGLAETASDDRD